MDKAEDSSRSWIRQHHASVAHMVMASDLITEPYDKLVALELALRFPHIFPSAATIAENCCISRRSVFVSLGRLATLGVLEIQKRARRNGGQTSSLYRFVGVEIPELGRRGGGGGGVQDEHGGGVQGNHQGGAAGAGGGVQAVHPLGVRELHPHKGKQGSYKLKVVGVARTRASSAPPSTRRTRATTPAPTVLFDSLKGWELSDELRSEWLQLARLPCSKARALELLEARITRKRRGRIGGASGGVADRDGYIRDHFDQWAVWERENLEKGQRGAAAGPCSSDRDRAKGVAAPPQRAAALKGFPLWVGDRHLALVRSDGQELRARAREWSRQHHIPPSSLDVSIAAQSFEQWLRRRLKAAA